MNDPNVEIERLRAALKDLSYVCTCDRPAVELPGGAVRSPGPHTAKCVRTRALNALAVAGGDIGGGNPARANDPASAFIFPIDALTWAAAQADNKIKVLGSDIHPAAKRVLEELAAAIRAGPTANVVSAERPYSKRDKAHPTVVTLDKCPKCGNNSLHPSERWCLKCDYVQPGSIMSPESLVEEPGTVDGTLKAAKAIVDSGVLDRLYPNGPPTKPTP